MCLAYWLFKQPPSSTGQVCLRGMLRGLKGETLLTPARHCLVARMAVQPDRLLWLG